MSPSVHATLHEAYRRELAELLEVLLTGEVVSDRATAERLIRSNGALQRLLDQHRPDKQGRCVICRQPPTHWWPWPKRTTCTVYSALSFFLRQPGRLVLAAVTNNPAEIRGTP